MSDMFERVTITNFKGKIKECIEDSTIEFAITRSGKPVGVYVGLALGKLCKNTLSIFRNSSESLLRSLKTHYCFQKSGKPEGRSLRDFELFLKQEKLKD